MLVPSAPERMLPCTAAPYATASSGLISLALIPKTFYLPTVHFSALPGKRPLAVLEVVRYFNVSTMDTREARTF